MLCDGLIVIVASLVLAQVPGISVDRYALSVTALFFLAMGFTLFASFRHFRRIVEAKVPGRQTARTAI